MKYHKTKEKQTGEQMWKEKEEMEEEVLGNRLP